MYGMLPYLCQVSGLQLGRFKGECHGPALGEWGNKIHVDRMGKEICENNPLCPGDDVGNDYQYRCLMIHLTVERIRRRVKV